MVRTSDFQFENVGSIPSNPILKTNLNITKLNFFNKKNNKLNKNLKFKFLFVSLIPPFIVNNVRLNFNSLIKEKKILIKQSYILLTWFYYLSFINQNVKNKNKLNFFVLPIKREKFTLTKAPMAHKNWSKEQYKFQYYKFNISFNVLLKEDNNLNSLNLALLFILLTKQNFPIFETNVFFIKNINFLLFTYDSKFFNYYNFINKFY